MTFEPEGENLTDEEWKVAWLPELQARVEAYERGDGESSDWRDVIARLRVMCPLAMKSETESMTPALNRHVVSETYRPPVMFAFALQIPIAILCFLMLDGGQLARVCGVAMAAHWLGILLLMVRRPFVPTKVDLAFVRWAFLGIFGLTAFLHEWLW